MQTYNRLIEDFCASAGIEDVGDVLHRGLVEIEDLPVRIEYMASSDQCRIFVDFGEMPAEHAGKLHELMLESNFDNEAEGLPILSVHPGTRHAVLAVHLPVGSMLAGSGLMGAIREHVLPAAEWWADVAGANAPGAQQQPAMYGVPAPLAGAFV